MEEEEVHIRMASKAKVMNESDSWPRKGQKELEMTAVSVKFQKKQ